MRIDTQDARGRLAPVDDADRTAAPSSVSKVDAASPSGPPMKSLPPAPPPFASRPGMDLEALCYLMKESVEASIKSTGSATEAMMKQRSEKAHAQTQKAEEARAAAADRGFWDKIKSAFAWIAEAIGTTIAIATAVLTTSPLAVVIAAAAVLNSVLEHSKAYELMGDFGKVLSGCLKTVSAAGNAGSLYLTAVAQTLEKSGILSEIAKRCAGLAIALNASLTVGSTLSSFFWARGRLVASPSLSDLQKVAMRVASILKGAASVTSGVGQIGSAVKQHQADSATLDAKQLRIEADKLRKGIRDLMDQMTEEVERRGRVLNLTVEVQEGKHTVAMALAASVRA